MNILLLMLILILIIGTVLIALYSAKNKKSVQFEQISSNNVTQRFCDKCGAELKEIIQSFVINVEQKLKINLYGWKNILNESGDLFTNVFVLNT